MKTFVTWLKFNPPSVASIEEWDFYLRDFKEHAPLRFLFVFVFPGWIKTVKSKYEKFVDKILRPIDSSVIQTKLPNGHHPACDLILHSNFSILVNYVEVEKASMYVYLNSIHIRFFMMRLRYGWRNPVYGVKQLKSERSGPLGTIASEILSLYLWWTKLRTSRKILINYATHDSSNFDKMVQHVEMVKHQLTLWDKEDTEMLNRLVAIRPFLIQ